MIRSLRSHWPEYLIEGALLGLFMVAAGASAVLLDHPDSAVRRVFPDAGARRALGGAAMGLTAIALFYSPWGQRSGAHINPAVTLTFLRRGKIRPWDAAFYVAAQFAGGLAGLLLARAAFGPRLADAAVNYAATAPGPAGATVAFVAEAMLACGMMTMLLFVSNSARWARWTSLFAGVLVALYITFESPLSGMSINPARTLASAIPSGTWTAVWIYFVAPPLGMLAANEIHRRLAPRPEAGCAKMHHSAQRHCIFCGQIARPERVADSLGERRVLAARRTGFTSTV